MLDLLHSSVCMPGRACMFSTAGRTGNAGPLPLWRRLQRQARLGQFQLRGQHVAGGKGRQLAHAAVLLGWICLGAGAGAGAKPYRWNSRHPHCRQSERRDKHGTHSCRRNLCGWPSGGQPGQLSASCGSRAQRSGKQSSTCLPAPLNRDNGRGRLSRVVSAVPAPGERLRRHAL